MTDPATARLEAVLAMDPIPDTDFGVLHAALRAEREANARLNAELDVAFTTVASVTAERDALRAARGADPVTGERRRPRETVASALRAFDFVTRNGFGTGSGVIDELRNAAGREGLRVDGLDSAALIAACRAHVAAQPADVLGLSAATAEALS